VEKCINGRKNNAGMQIDRLCECLWPGLVFLVDSMLVYVMTDVLQVTDAISRRRHTIQAAPYSQRFRLKFITVSLRDPHELACQGLNLI
jgi:hypothetical protein